jgi:hypothetical protein
VWLPVNPADLTRDRAPASPTSTAGDVVADVA